MNLIFLHVDYFDWPLSIEEQDATYLKTNIIDFRCTDVKKNSVLLINNYLKKLREEPGIKFMPTASSVDKNNLETIGVTPLYSDKVAGENNTWFIMADLDHPFNRTLKSIIRDKKLMEIC